MGQNQLIVIAACIVLLLVLFALRRSAAMKGDIPQPLAIGGVVVAVLVAGGLLYRATNTPKATDDGAGDMAGMLEEQGGMGGMGGGARPPSPHRELEQIVRKIAMLRSQDANAITNEQGTKLLPILTSLAATEGMTTEEAEGKKAELEALLSQELATALATVELPRRRRGGPGGGTEAPPPEGGRPGGPGGGDWRAAMQTRMLEIPYVKKLYDEKLAADPELADDEDKRSEFFRGLRNSLSPFLRDPAKEALQQLIQGLSPEQ